MNLMDAITKLVKDNNKSKRWLSERMGYKNASGISNMLMRGNATIETLLHMCELFDYELTIQPKRKSGSRPMGQIVIDKIEAPEKRWTRKNTESDTEGGEAP